jgi:phage protein U
MLTALPVGNYIVIETMQGFMFKRTDTFDEPGRMYGTINKRAKRIMTTFMDRPRTTGVLLAGEKGSGKSQLARVVSRLGYEENMPTIIINAPFHGDGFNQLLASIEQPAIILMDEFEKVYSDESHQEAVLTLLDGMMTSKKLFVLTVNNKYRVNDHMKNRPGRIFYSIDFQGLEIEFIREYCEDNLSNKEEIENIVKVSAMFKAFNFDMLKALVEEMNRYDETAFEAMEMLNAKPMDTSSGVTYEVVVTSPSGFKSNTFTASDIPLSGGREAVGIMATWPKPPEGFQKHLEELGMYEEDVDDDEFERHIAVSGKELRKIDVDSGKYEFKSGEFTVLFKRKVPTTQTWIDF